MRKSHYQILRIFVLEIFAIMQVYIIGLWNIRQFVKISLSGSQSPDPNTFLVSSLIKSFQFQNFQLVCCKMKENLCSFYCELQKSLDRMIQVIFFKHFWTNVSKLAGESMIKNLSQLRPVKISGPSVSDGFDDDNVCGRNDTEASKLPLSRILNLEFGADKDPVAGNLVVAGNLIVAFSHLYQNPLMYSWYPPVYS